LWPENVNKTLFGEVALAVLQICCSFVFYCRWRIELVFPYGVWCFLLVSFTP